MYRTELQSVPYHSTPTQVYVTVGGISHPAPMYHTIPKPNNKFSELEQYIAQFWPEDANTIMIMQFFTNLLETLQFTDQKDEADHTFAQTKQPSANPSPQTDGTTPQYIEYQHRFLTDLLPLKQKLVGVLYTENDETRPITENGLSLLVIKLIRKRIITLLQFQELFREHLDKLIITDQLVAVLSSIEQQSTLDTENDKVLEKIHDFFLNPDDYAQAGEIENFKRILREEIIKKIAAINQMHPEEKEAFNEKRRANMHDTKPIALLLTFSPQTLEEKMWCRYKKLEAILRRQAASPAELASLPREQLIILSIHPSLGTFVARKVLSLAEFCQLTDWQILVYANDNIIDLLNAGKLTHEQARNLTEHQFQILSSTVGVLVCNDQFTLQEAYQLTRAEALRFTEETITQLIMTGNFTAKEILQLNDSQIRILSHNPTFAEAIIKGFIDREKIFTLTLSSAELFNFGEENILTLLENGKIDVATVATLTYHQCLVLTRPEIFTLIKKGIISVAEVLTYFVAAWFRGSPESDNVEDNPRQNPIYILVESQIISFKELCELSELNYQTLIHYPCIIELLRDKVLSLDEFFKLNYAQLNLLSSRVIQALIKKNILTKEQAFSLSFTQIKCIEDEQIFPAIYNGFIDLFDPFFNNYISDAQFELLRDRYALIYYNAHAIIFLKRFKNFTLQTFLSLDIKQRQCLAHAELQMLITSDLLPITLFARLTSEQIDYLKTHQLFLLAHRIPVADCLANKTPIVRAMKPLADNIINALIYEFCQQINLDATLCLIFLQALANTDNPLPPLLTEAFVKERIGLVAAGLCDPITALVISAEELTSFTNDCKLKPVPPTPYIVRQQASSPFSSYAPMLSYYAPPVAVPTAAPRYLIEEEASAHTETASRDDGVAFVTGPSESDKLFPDPLTRLDTADFLPEGLPTAIPDDLSNNDENDQAGEYPLADYDTHEKTVRSLKRATPVIDSTAAHSTDASDGAVVTAPATTLTGDHSQPDAAADTSPESDNECSSRSGSNLVQQLPQTDRLNDTD